MFLFFGGQENILELKLAIDNNIVVIAVCGNEISDEIIKMKKE